MRLDQPSVLLAAHFRRGSDGDGTDGRAVEDALAAMAAQVEDLTLPGVVRALGEAGFGGDASEYQRVDASLLPDVLRRRRGLPILLAIVAVDVARRVGIEARVIGLPGHVLVGLPAGGGDGAMADPFHRRVELGPDEAQRLFHDIHGADARWDPAYLDPMTAPAVIGRVLANLARRLQAEGRHREEAVALGLRSLVPGGDPSERVALASALARSGRFDHAASELERLAEHGGGGRAPDELRTRAQQWRARLN